jgi:hypothetical protein
MSIDDRDYMKDRYWERQGNDTGAGPAVSQFACFDVFA